MSRRKPLTNRELYFRSAKESGIQKAVRELLWRIGIVHSETDASRCWDATGKPSRPRVDQGWPDLSGTIPGYWPKHAGRSLYVETKAATGGFQPGQRECHASLRAAGALVFVPRSLDDFILKMIEAGLDHPLFKQLVRRVAP